MALTQFFSLMFPRNEVEIKKNKTKQKQKQKHPGMTVAKSKQVHIQRMILWGKNPSETCATFAGNSSNIRSQTSS